jgi:hypothetical protein
MDSTRRMEVEGRKAAEVRGTARWAAQFPSTSPSRRDVAEPIGLLLSTYACMAGRQGGDRPVPTAAAPCKGPQPARCSFNPRIQASEPSAPVAEPGME